MRPDALLGADAGRGRHVERLPTPWGLVRLGVAPDHPNIKAVSRAFEKIARGRASASSATSRSGATSPTRTSCASTTRSSTPSARRPTGGSAIPGEDLPGSWPATAFVAWYNGHPDFQDLEFDLVVERAVVVGNGNVAVDVARMLALTREELAPTDTTDAAIDAIDGVRHREIVVLGRRGPVQAAFTTPELKELGELAGADVVVDPAELELEPASGRRWPATERPAEHRGAARVRRACARGQAEPDRAALPRLAGRDPRRRAGRGDRARAQRARRGRGRPDRARADRRARDDVVRARLPQRRLPRRRAPGRSVRRGARHDPQRRRPRARRRRRARAAASTAPAGSSAARAASSARTRRTRPRRSSSCSRTRAAGSCRVRRPRELVDELLAERGVEPRPLRGLGRRSTRSSAPRGEPQGRPRVKLARWDELLDAAARGSSLSRP